MQLLVDDVAPIVLGHSSHSNFDAICSTSLSSAGGPEAVKLRAAAGTTRDSSDLTLVQHHFRQGGS